jgi:hypothetical protein
MSRRADWRAADERSEVRATKGACVRIGLRLRARLNKRGIVDRSTASQRGVIAGAGNTRFLRGSGEAADHQTCWPTGCIRDCHSPSSRQEVSDSFGAAGGRPVGAQADRARTGGSSGPPTVKCLCCLIFAKSWLILTTFQIHSSLRQSQVRILAPQPDTKYFILQ